MKKKIIITLTLVLVLVISSINFAYAESPFTDIDKNWAKDYIISVYEKGLVKGTSNDKFSPDNSVNKYSVIVTIAKMMNAEEENLDDLVEKYKTDLGKFEVPQYAKKETAFALSKEILFSDFDLDKMKDKPLASKLDICVYLGRAFGVEQDPTIPVQLYFRDTELVPRGYRGFVNHMIDIGVIDGKGNKDGDLKPDDLVTRAMFAKMLDEASNAYEKEFGTINYGDELPGEADDDEWPDDDFEEDILEDEHEDSSTMVSAKGIIDSIIYSRKEKPRIKLETEGKSMKEFYIPEDLIKEDIIINGHLSDVYSLRPGMFVELRAQNNIVRNIATIEFSNDIKAEAIIRSIDLLNAEIHVDIMDENDQIVKEKKVYLQQANLVDSALNPLLLDDLKRGQSIYIVGIEDETGIKAITAMVL